MQATNTHSTNIELPLTSKSPAKKLSTLANLWPFLRPYRSRVFLAFILLCLGSATLLLVPLAFRDLIDFGFVTKAASTNTHNGLIGSLSLNGHFLVMFALAVFWALMMAWKSVVRGIR